MAVLHVQRQEFHRPAAALNLERAQRLDSGLRCHDGRITARTAEDIIEAPLEALLGRCIEISWDLRALANGKCAHIVNAMRLVSMIVRVDHCVEMGRAAREELFAQVWRRVDQDPGHGAGLVPAFHQRAAARPPVARLRRIACAPVPANARHAARRTGSEKDHARPRHQGATLENKRTAFCVVTCLIVSVSTPIRAPSASATCTRYDGSLRRPRIGIGAR